MAKKRGVKFTPYDYEAAFDKNLEDIHCYFVEQLLKNKKTNYVYALKEIYAGEQLEVEIYPEFSKAELPAGFKIIKDNSRAQRNLNDKNARKYVERLINENFGNRDTWITLTYSEGQEPQNFNEAIKNMQNYIRRVNYQRKKRGLKNARYIYVTEHSPEDKIRWHHHIVMDGNLDIDIIEAAWKKGRRNEVRRLDKDEYGLAGMAIYITKQKDRKKHEKRWCSSQGLKQPRIRKIHNKRPAPNQGAYRPIERYVKAFINEGAAAVENQMKKWYPNYQHTESEIYYNDFNGMFYIKTRMRRNVNDEKKGRRRNHKEDHSGGDNAVYSPFGGIWNKRARCRKRE